MPLLSVCKMSFTINAFVASVRTLVERIIKLLKRPKCFSEKWRGDLGNHARAMHFIANTVNIQLRTHPASAHLNEWLF